MNERYLTIMEVSQKQAYIFQSNELKKNILNSAVIAWIMDVDYLEEKADDPKLFHKEDNLVYSGGGHIVLEFAVREQADDFVRKVTRAIRKEYPGIDVFAKTIPFDDRKSPSWNLKELTKALERKKAERRAAFHQGSFGVEKTDTNTLRPILCHGEEASMPKKEEETDRNLMAAGYRRVFRFEDLGGSRDSSNFIAVVHIDGNAMGKRVEKLQQRYGELDWEAYKESLRQFSESIDKDFKAAYKDMSEYVADRIRSGSLSSLDLTDNDFPVRRIITAGDDICFVAEGRIGLECAAAFIDSLGSRRNSVDQEGYAACAGVAVVHRKYPFYKAYELAEMLCSNAKKYGAALSSDGSGSDVSVLDWHVEFGEIRDTLDEIRAEYLDADGNSVSGRPYIVRSTQSLTADSMLHSYQRLRGLIRKLQDDESCARGTIKELRGILKLGQDETKYFMRFHKIEDLIKWDPGDDYKMLFDAIELIDTFIALEDREEAN